METEIIFEPDLKDLKAPGSALIEGLPGVGLVAKGAVAYLLESLGGTRHISSVGTANKPISADPKKVSRCIPRDLVEILFILTSLQGHDSSRRTTFTYALEIEYMSPISNPKSRSLLTDSNALRTE